GVPGAFLCGAMEEAGGTLHTGKFVLGLRKAALERGIRIYEQTAVQRIEGRGPIRIVTAGGTVSAGRLVMASNAYTGEIGRPGERISPLRSEEHTSELQSRENLVCRLLLEKKKKK